MLTSKRFINRLDQHRRPCNCSLVLMSANNFSLWWTHK